MPPRNIFNAAKSAPKKPAAKTKPEVETIHMGGVEKLAAIRVLMGALKEAEAQLSAQVRQSMVSHFVERGTELKSRPPNFKATDGLAEASCQLQVRGTALRPDEVTLIQEHGLPLNGPARVAALAGKPDPRDAVEAAPAPAEPTKDAD